MNLIIIFIVVMVVLIIIGYIDGKTKVVSKSTKGRRSIYKNELDGFNLDPNKVSVIQKGGLYAVVYNGTIYKQLIDNSRDDGWDGREWVKWSDCQYLAECTAKNLQKELLKKPKKIILEYELDEEKK